MVAPPRSTRVTWRAGEVPLDQVIHRSNPGRRKRRLAKVGELSSGATFAGPGASGSGCDESAVCPGSIKWLVGAAEAIADGKYVGLFEDQVRAHRTSCFLCGEVHRLAATIFLRAIA